MKKFYLFTSIIFLAITGICQENHVQYYYIYDCLSVTNGYTDTLLMDDFFLKRNDFIYEGISYLSYDMTYIFNGIKKTISVGSNPVIMEKEHRIDFEGKTFLIKVEYMEKLTSILIKALKEQQLRIEALEREVNKLDR